MAEQTVGNFGEASRILVRFIAWADGPSGGGIVPAATRSKAAAMLQACDARQRVDADAPTEAMAAAEKAAVVAANQAAMQALTRKSK